MSEFHKYFLTNIFEGLEERSDATPEFPDIMTLGEKVKAAKSAKIDALTFLEKCYHAGMSVPESLAALDAATAKASSEAGAASDAAKA